MRILETTELGAGHLALLSDVRVEEAVKGVAFSKYSSMLRWRELLDVALDYGLDKLAKRSAIEIVRLTRSLSLSG